MVHVEVFLGGCSTIGARARRGVIQVHDHYLFTSESYTDIQVQFKSIDTWLDGVCKSFCPIHPWGESRLVSRSKVKRKKKEGERDRPQGPYDSAAYSIL